MFVDESDLRRCLTAAGERDALSGERQSAFCHTNTRD